MNLIKRIVKWAANKLGITTEVTQEVAVTDPNGLLPKDITIIKKHMGNGKYQVGDSVESVAYRQGQHDLLDVIEQQLPRWRQQHGIPK